MVSFESLEARHFVEVVELAYALDYVSVAFDFDCCEACHEHWHL